jgi:hypothetical protein
MAGITKEFVKARLKEHGISGKAVDDALRKCRKFNACSEIEYSGEGIDAFIREHNEIKA